ncbi:MAG: DJ-1/PfpI/YhbO family deglycase/protease [Elainellaceae cyanobacterium]
MANANGSRQKRVAILIENHFEDSEFSIPYNALQKAGANVTVLGSRMNEEYKGKRGQATIKPTATATEVRSEDFDAIVIPGGAAPDRIRTNPNAVRLVIDAMAQNKLVAAVCHGPQVLIEADQLRNRQATGYRSIRVDMQNAGATYVDEPVVVDKNLITSRRPGDLSLFTVMVLSNLGVGIDGTTFPDTSDQSFEWWQLAEEWGGSSKQDIVNVLNIVVIGERYTLEAFRQYGDRTVDQELKLVLDEIRSIKQNHVAMLESRLQAFDEEVTWQAIGSDAYATLINWLQSSNDESIMRRALGDIQTGIVDLSKLSSRITDPITVNLMSQIESNLARCEQRLASLYRARLGDKVESPMPTTLTAV